MYGGRPAVSIGLTFAGRSDRLRDRPWGLGTRPERMAAPDWPRAMS